MTSQTFFFLFIPILAVILLGVNLVFAPHNPYGEKDSAFECGFHSFLGQNRSEFSISFFIFALLFFTIWSRNITSISLHSKCLHKWYIWPNYNAYVFFGVNAGICFWAWEKTPSQ